MKSVYIYAAVIGGMTALFLVFRLLPHVIQWCKTNPWLNARYLTNARFINRHRLVGPYTWASLFLHTLYISINIFFAFYPDGVDQAGHRCGVLALSNLAFLYVSPSISFLADLLGIRLQSCRRLHRAAGWMTCVQTGLHIIFDLTSMESISLQERGIISGIIVSASIFSISIMSAPLIRRFIYPIFYIAHYLLSILVVCALWTHLPHGSSGSWYLIYVAISIFGAAAVFAICVIFYRNGACGDYWSKGAIVKRDDGSMRIDVYPGRPVMVLPGQYINLWCPSLNPWSWFQGSSFIVTSWSPEKQAILQLFAKCPNRSFGFTWLLLWRTLTNSRRNLTFISGPHGLSEPVSRYETVLLVASDTGILPIKPYVEQLFYCVKKRTSKTRRLRLVWQVSGRHMGMSLLADMGAWVNRLFQDDIEDETHVCKLQGTRRRLFLLTISVQMLQITIFDPNNVCKMTPGQHGVRGQVSQTCADLESILEDEVRDHKQRLAEDVKNERGEMLVMGELGTLLLGTSLTTNSFCFRQAPRQCPTICQGLFEVAQYCGIGISAVTATTTMINADISSLFSRVQLEGREQFLKWVTSIEILASSHAVYQCTINHVCSGCAA